MINRQNALLGSFTKRFIGRKKGKKSVSFAIDKRKKIVIGTIFLALSLFIAEYKFSQAGLYISVLLPILTNIFIFWALYQDIRESFTYEVFLLPFFYSLAFALFYFLTPAVFLSRIIITAIYAFGLYSLFLSQNIFIVSSFRSIQLLSGARIVSFVITLMSFFFLTNIVFTFHFSILPTIAIIFLYTYLLMYHSMWTYTLAKIPTPLPLWVLALTCCISEIAAVLWFWPSSPTVISLFLTGFFYNIGGLSHIWFEKRLFKGVLWEYVWVGAIVFFVLILFTQWGK